MATLNPVLRLASGLRRQPQAPAPERILERELDEINFDALVASEAAGCIAPDELAVLEANRDRWVERLRDLLADTEEALDVVARSDREEREQALLDLSDERDSLADSLFRLTGEDVGPLRNDAVEALDELDALEPDEPREPALQASWASGEVVLWGGNHGSAPVPRDELDALIDKAGASAIEWVDHQEVPLPSGDRAVAVAAPVTSALGWLVGVGAGQLAT
jgi:hypothetical protein